MEKPAFYMASAETTPLLAPRKVFPIRRLRGRQGDDWLLVRVEPPIPGAVKSTGEVVIATRWAGETLYPVSTWPMGVFVCRIVNESVRRTGEASADDLEVIYWAELFPTMEDAEKSLKPFRGRPRD